MKINTEHFTISAVARELGCSSAGLHHHIRAGLVPEPTYVLKKRKYYLPADVETIRAYWASRVPAGCSRFTAEDVAEMRRLWVEGWTQGQIAAHYHALQSNVSQLLTGLVLPGYRGGAIGHGRTGRRVKRRRRNLGVSSVATAV
jgi:DNA-binding transcriptional MerR regulator